MFNISGSEILHGILSMSYLTMAGLIFSLIAALILLIGSKKINFEDELTKVFVAKAKDDARLSEELAGKGDVFITTGWEKQFSRVLNKAQNMTSKVNRWAGRFLVVGFLLQFIGAAIHL